jgi:ribonuclease Y
MSTLITVLLLALAGAGGVALGYYLRHLISLGKKTSAEIQIKQTLLEAKENAQKIVSEAESKADELVESAKKEVKEREDILKKTENRLLDREALLDKRQLDLDADVEGVKQRIEEITEIKTKIQEMHEKEVKELERISGLSLDEAKQELFASLEKDSNEDIVVRLQKLEIAGKERLEARAREILTTVIHRLGNAVPSDVMSTSISLPSDEIKGKIIGKEGRNIKAFERAAGVEVIIDDTPGTIILSCFDPVRRQVARVALENLIMDGRIQPAKIEEHVQKAEKEINRIIKEKGEQAAYEAGVLNLDPRILNILGRLYFRTSYGQNVLQHSVEMAHIAGMIAEELGADPQIARAGALVHDIGKAVDHEVQGTHVEIGRRILQKFGADERIIKAMQAHHEEYPYETVESVIVQVADAISGSRPGARRDSVENYIKRLTELEAIGNSFEGVEKCYAISAGREIRVFVRPENVNDLEAHQMARDMALKIEKELRFPGEIKVAVIRETRAIEYAR